MGQMTKVVAWKSQLIEQVSRWPRRTSWTSFVSLGEERAKVTTTGAPNPQCCQQVTPMDSHGPEG